jgi:Tfp pilus assembly protein PilF
LILYYTTLNSAFLNYDDPAYVTANTHVLKGLSWSNIRWALTATVEANWHPLTWISHMFDVQFFGSNPSGHHIVNVLLHASNVVLLFLVLWKATANILRSAVVAAVFAVHPLNVECVAWIAERKSLLSMLFLLLSFAVYGWYAQKRSIGRYLPLFVLYGIGLAAKPMIVTLPILLLLWDYWPLDRTRSDAEYPADRCSFTQLVGEKIPLFALSAASTWITLYAQHRGGALGSTDLLPLAWRIKNALYSYLAYVDKGLWPSGLAVFYPHPEGTLPTWKATAAALVVLVMTALTWRYRRNHRYLFVGWLWYLIAMLPMIGIVQVGRQAMADRYAYLPFVGLFLLAVWGCAHLFTVLKLSKLAVGGIAAVVLIGLSSATFLQVRYWDDSFTLFSHAVAVTARNGVAEDNLGTALMQMGRADLAMPHFEAAVEFTPQLSTAHYNLGVLRQQQNQLAAAKYEYELALKYSADPVEIAQAHGNLGFLLMELNHLSGANEEFSAALQVNPDKQNCMVGRGIVEYRQGNLDAAARDLSRAAQLAPSAPADFWLGKVFESKGQAQAAAAAYEAALQLAPGMTEAQQRLNALRGLR